MSKQDKNNGEQNIPYTSKVLLGKSYYPYKWSSQVMAIYHYKYYCNCLNKFHDEKRALSCVMKKFKRSASTIKNSISFGRALKSQIDPEEMEWQEKNK